jgi:hypothetical protein
MQGADGVFFFSALAFGDFFAVDAYVDGGLDADAYLRAVDRHHGHFNVVANSQRFPSAPSKYEHAALRHAQKRLHVGNTFK